MIPINKPTADYFQILQSISNSKETKVDQRIARLLNAHSNDLIADLIIHPEHRQNYEKIISILKDNPSVQSSLANINKIAACLGQSSKEGIKLTAQDSTLIPVLSSVIAGFPNLKLPEDIEKVRAISHPALKAMVIANYINQHETPLSTLQLSKQEILEIAPHLTFVDCQDCLDDFSENEILSFLNSCSPLVKTLKICTNKISELPLLPNCQILDCSKCKELTKIQSMPSCKELNCQKCPKLIALPDLRFCEKLNCKECILLKSFPKIIFCRELDCRHCIQISELPDLSLCQILKCANCPLKKLPELNLCHTLDCSFCRDLDNLPNLPLCKTLHCHDCPKLEKLPELQFCQILDCSDCPKLSSLPMINFCKALNCSNCPELRELPVLKRCLTLNCSSCSNLRKLPKLDVCQILNCTGCTSLIELTPLNHCETLNCTGCRALLELPNLPACKDLYCTSCILLRRLPDLNHCQSLDCSYCTLLRSLPALHSCRNLNYRNCVDLVLQSVPLRFRPINSSDMENREFTIPIKVEELNKNPLKILLDLEESVLEKRFLPKITFIENEERSAKGIDLGGVSRVFISRLMQSLAIHSNEKDQLKLVAMKSGLLVPALDFTGDLKTQIKSFQILGGILDLCLGGPGLAPLTTGIIFDRVFFKMLLTLSYQELETIDLETTEIPTELIIKLMAQAEGNKTANAVLIPQEKLTPEQFEELREVISVSVDEDDMVFPDKFHNKNLSIDERQELYPWVQKVVREILEDSIKELTKDQNIYLPALLIAKQLQMRKGTIEEWEILRMEGAEELETKIQGILDGNVIFKAFKWSVGDRKLDKALVEQTKDFLENWLSTATSKNLKDFNSFVTGAPTLKSDTSLECHFYDTPAVNFPTTHSCYNTLDIPVNYGKYSTFKERLEFALEQVNNPNSSGFESI